MYLLLACYVIVASEEFESFVKMKFYESIKFELMGTNNNNTL